MWMGLEPKNSIRDLNLILNILKLFIFNVLLVKILKMLLFLQVIGSRNKFADYHSIQKRNIMKITSTLLKHI